MAVKYEKIVEEDLNVGTGTVDVTMPGGGTVVGHRIGIQSFVALAVIASMDGGQNITGGAAAATVQLDTEELDVVGWFNPTTYSYTPTVDGVYQIDAYLKLAGFTGVATVGLYKNGSLVVANEMYREATSGQITLSAQVAMNGTTDVLTLKASHQDGANLREIQYARFSAVVVGKALAA